MMPKRGICMKQSSHHEIKNLNSAHLCCIQELIKQCHSRNTFRCQMLKAWQISTTEMQYYFQFGWPEGATLPGSRPERWKGWWQSIIPSLWTGSVGTTDFSKAVTQLQKPKPFHEMSHTHLSFRFLDLWYHSTKRLYHLQEFDWRTAHILWEQGFFCFLKTKFYFYVKKNNLCMFIQWYFESLF